MEEETLIGELTARMVYAHYQIGNELETKEVITKGAGISVLKSEGEVMIHINFDDNVIISLEHEQAIALANLILAAAIL